MNDMETLFTQHKDALRDLLRYGVLKADAMKNPGLFNGRLGMAIIFYEYSRYSEDTLYEQLADEILESIIDLPDTLSFYLADGLCGIGWGIIYLLREKFIIGDIDDILSEIDIKIQKKEFLENDEIKDRHTYLTFRENYITQKMEEKRSYIPNHERNILNQIWVTCLNNQLIMKH